MHCRRPQKARYEIRMARKGEGFCVLANAGTRSGRPGICRLPCRGEARSGLLRGAFSTGCSKRKRSSSTRSAVRAPARSMPSCSLRVWRRAVASKPAPSSKPSGARSAVAVPFVPFTRLTRVDGHRSSGLGNWLRTMAPMQFNPFDLNPLRAILSAEVDFERLNATSRIALLIAATRVEDGRLHIFRDGDLDPEKILASACLPLLHHTVYVDGVPYWDGGYVANPPLIPLALESTADDLLVVQILPSKIDAVPTNVARYRQTGRPDLSQFISADGNRSDRSVADDERRRLVGGQRQVRSTGNPPYRGGGRDSNVSHEPTGPISIGVFSSISATADAPRLKPGSSRSRKPEI